MLRKLIRFTKSDNSIVLLGNLLASAFGLVTFMLLARLLDKASFGSWAIFISASGLIELMKTGLIRQALVRQLSISKKPDQHQSIISAAWVLTIVASIILAGSVAAVGLVVKHESLKLFFNYYPIFCILSIASSFTAWLAHARGEYFKMNLVRVLINGSFLLFIGIGFLIEIDLQKVILGYLGAHLLVALFYYFFELRLISLRRFQKNQVIDLVAFGKHSLATLTGANLLKSADSLIIGWLMGAESVAIYAIPLKVLDLLEIPLRGFVMTSFRKLTSLFAAHDISAFKSHAFKNIKALTALFVVGACIIFFIPELVVRVLGGAGFEQSIPLLRLFLLPMVLLPLDKFLGISLDAVNLPKINAIKVWIMVIINIIGDIIAIQMIGELWAVALVTILNIIAGIVFGFLANPVLRNPKY